MKTKIFISIVSLLIICGLNSCSKNEDFEVFATLHGIVVDDASGEPIPGATITLSPGGRTQTSGSDGRYQFSNVDAMQYTVTVQKPGYNTNRKMVTVVAGEATEANVSLHKIQ